MKLFKQLLVVATMSFCIACADKVDSQQQTEKNKQGITVGVQLWSVQDKLKQDFKGTIEALAGMGFQAVETAGVFGEFENDPAGLKAYLSSLGMVVSGAHVGFDALTEDTLAKTIEFYKSLGATYLIIPWDDRAWHPEKVKDLVADLNRLLPVINEAGFEFGYHNHAEEFTEFQQQTYWDFIAQQSANNMVLQLDVGWVNYAGKDPIHYVKTYKGQTLTTHYKVRTHEGSGQIPLLGQDGYDWLALFGVMEQFGGTKWVIVEQEEYPEGLSSLEAVAQSKLGLNKLLNH